jgi:hypothetical protein
MRRIHVGVVAYGDCKNLVMRYKDPVTGKWSRSTKYRDPVTGEETETGTNRKEARRLAALWEADLNSSRDQGRRTTGWPRFRLRYESEVLPGLAEGTAVKVATVCNLLERMLPKVATGKLADLNPEAVSRFQAALRDSGRSESTIASYLGHSRAMLAWAHDQGMIPTMPKIKRPQRAQQGSKGRKSKGRPITAEELDRMMGKIPAALCEWRKRQRDAARTTRRNKGKAVRKTVADFFPWK